MGLCSFSFRCSVAVQCGKTMSWRESDIHLHTFLYQTLLECSILWHYSNSSSYNDQGQGTSDPPFQFSVTELRTCTSITSTATVTTTSDLNGTLVLCQDGIGMLPDQNSTITLRDMGIIYLYLDKQAVDN